MVKSVRDTTPDEAIVVWMARVSDLPASLAELEALLGPNERDRAARFRFAEDRARFIAGRGLLRHALRRYAPEVPGAVEIILSPLGRPLLPAEYEAPQFSISHSGDIVALAFTGKAQIGVDVEHMQPTADLPKLAERILSADDYRQFEALPADEKQLAFYRAWTRKESYLKARGEGIATALPHISVSLGPEPGSLHDARDASASGWRLNALPTPADYQASVACDDANRDLRCYGAKIEAGKVSLTRVL